MIFKPKVAILFAAGIGTALLLVPASAFAAPKSTKKITVTRDTTDPHRVQISWTPVTGAHHYNVSVFNGTTDDVKVVSAGTTTLSVTEAGACTRLRVNIGSRDAAGLGATSSNVWVQSLAPGGVSALAAERAKDGTTLTATWKAPASVGYGTPGGYQVTLVNASTKATVSETVVRDASATVPGLDPKINYMLKVTAINQYGSCATATLSVRTTASSTVTSLKAVRDTANPNQVTVSWAQPAYVGRSPITHYLVGYGATKATQFVKVEGTTSTLTLDAGTASVVTIQPVSADGAGQIGTIKVPAAGPAATAATKPGITIDQNGGQIIVRLTGKIGAYAEYPKLVVRVRSVADASGFSDEQWGQNGAQTLLFGEIPSGAYVVTVNGANATGEAEWGKKILNVGDAGLMSANGWKIIAGKPVLSGTSITMNQQGGVADVLSASERPGTSMTLMSTLTLRGTQNHGIWLRAAEDKGRKVSGYLVVFGQRAAAGSKATETTVTLRIQDRGQLCGTALATTALPATTAPTAATAVPATTAPTAKTAPPATTVSESTRRLAVMISGDSLYVTVDDAVALDIASLAAVTPAACQAATPTGTRAGIHGGAPAGASVTFTRTTLN